MLLSDKNPNGNATKTHEGYIYDFFQTAIHDWE